MPGIDMTNNLTWANSWIKQLDEYLTDSPVILRDSLDRFMTIKLPTTIKTRKRVVQRIRAHSKYDGIKKRLAERVPGYILDDKLPKESDA